MENAEAFKKKAGETAGFVADKGLEVAKCAAEKAFILGQMATARADLAMERENLKRARVILGKAYYKKFGQDPEDEMAETCAQVEKSLKRIARRKAELAELKVALKTNPFAADDEA